MAGEPSEHRECPLLHSASLGLPGHGCALMVPVGPTQTDGAILGEEDSPTCWVRAGGDGGVGLSFWVRA